MNQTAERLRLLLENYYIPIKLSLFYEALLCSKLVFALEGVQKIETCNLDKQARARTKDFRREHINTRRVKEHAHE